MKSQEGKEVQIFSEVRLDNFIFSNFLSYFSLIWIKIIVVIFPILVSYVWFTGGAIAQKDSSEIVLEGDLSEFEDQSLDEKVENVLSGFDDEEDEYETSEENQSLTTNGWSSLYGSTGLNLSYSYLKELPAEKTEADWSGLTKVQPFLSLTWDVKLGENWKTRISGKVLYNFAYGMKERENYSSEVLNELEQEAEFREIYLEGSPLVSLDIKLGKQIIVWGMADSLRVVDVLNPIDNREFGMTNLEDTRIPIKMTKLNYFVGDLKLEAIAVHEIKFNKSAPFGSDFNTATKKIDEVIPESSIDNTEYGLAFIGTFSGWDASINWAQYFDDTAHFKISSITIVPGVGVATTYERVHSRLTMIGGAVSATSGNYILKAELAKLEGLEFAIVPEKKFSRFDVLLGLEYFGLSDASVSIESGLQHLNDFEPRLENLPDSEKEDNFATSVGFTQDYFNQTLQLNIFGMMIGERGKDGGVNRISLKYDLVDAFSIKGGMMLYQSGESEYFQNLNKNDRIFFEARYSF